MGLILDSSVIILGERKGSTVADILEAFAQSYPQTVIGLSVVTVVELTHGVCRAKTEGRRARRQAFVDELIRDLTVYDLNVEISRLAGTIEGDLAESGVGIAFEDLLIAATALHLGFGVVTANVKHFQVVPGLQVIAG